MGRKRADLLGKRFEKLVVIDYFDFKNKNSRWLCKCDCGNEKVISGQHLLDKKFPTSSCGCINRRDSNFTLVGEKFDRLLVIEFSHIENFKSGVSQFYWKCRCDCGGEIVVSESHLKSKHTRSCGCLKIEIKTNLIHGMSNTKFYKCWESMKRRCDNINESGYKNYGGRGIGYEPPWDLFENFYNDMYLKYLYAKKQLKIKRPSIERIDVNGNYCKENCCFIEMKDQSKNKRCIKKFLATNVELGRIIITKNQSEFARSFGLNNSGVYKCLNGFRNKTGGWKFRYI